MVSKLRTAFKNIKVIVVTELLLMVVMVSTIVVKADAINDRRVVTKYLNVATLRTISSDNKSSESTGMKATITNAETERNIKVAEDKRVSVISFARQFIGKPYVLGGKSLTNGCDCASFITLVYKEYGYNWKMGSVNTLYDNCGGTLEVLGDFTLQCMREMAALYTLWIQHMIFVRLISISQVLRIPIAARVYWQLRG